MADVRHSHVAFYAVLHIAFCAVLQILHCDVAPDKQTQGAVARKQFRRISWHAANVPVHVLSCCSHVCMSTFSQVFYMFDAQVLARVERRGDVRVLEIVGKLLQPGRRHRVARTRGVRRMTRGGGSPRCGDAAARRGAHCHSCLASHLRRGESGAPLRLLGAPLGADFLRPASASCVTAAARGVRRRSALHAATSTTSNSALERSWSKVPPSYSQRWV